MVKTPHFILQYVHALDSTLEALGMRDVEIRVIAIASLDGRPYQLMIDPTVDLSDASYGWFEVPNWIVPLQRNKRPGLYPRSSEERRAMLQAVVDDYNGARRARLARVPLQPMPAPDEDPF